MDVTCPRCQTDYEFDDALVSERGTSVKCTSCGHQFRVFRPGSADATGQSPATELWRIERNEGGTVRVTELRSLVELQRAIRGGRVSPEDLLRRGDTPARRVGDIPELEPFFPGSAGAAPITQPLAVADRRPAEAGRAQGSGTLRPPSSLLNPAEQAQMPSAVVVPTEPARRFASTARPPPFDPPRRRSDRAPAMEPPVEREAHARADARPVPANLPSERFSPSISDDLESMAPSQPASHDPYDSVFPAGVRKRRSGGAVVVGAIVLAGVGILAFTMGKPYLTKALGGSSPASSSSASDRLDRELAAADRAQRDGDDDGARQAYMRATVIDPKSLAAWDGLCAAESELAIMHWVAALAGDSALERDQASMLGGGAGRSCARWAEIARMTETGTKKVSADYRPIRSLAAQGDGPGVRIHLAAHPGDALLEAMSILADATNKDASSITAATKLAAAAIAKVDLASLATPGDVALAAFCAAVGGPPGRAENALAELSRRAPRYMLIETLRKLSAGGVAGSVATSVGASGGDAGAVDAATPSDARGNAPAVSAFTPPVGGHAPVGGGAAPQPPAPEEASGNDYRALNQKAHQALSAGDTTKAETMFQAALAQHPGDIDALFGLGQISRSRGDHAGAIGYFKQVLDASSGFTSARLALADEQWAIGAKDEAAANYELYLDRVSSGAGADRARERTGKSAKAEEPTPPAAPPTPPPDPAPATTQ